MLAETYYLCRVPSYDIIVMFNEADYKYQRHHEEHLREPNEKYNLELLAKGTKKQIRMYYDLIQEDNNVS
jgi:hypothetical protein